MYVCTRSEVPFPKSLSLSPSFVRFMTWDLERERREKKSENDEEMVHYNIMSTSILPCKDRLREGEERKKQDLGKRERKTKITVTAAARADKICAQNEEITYQPRGKTLRSGPRMIFYSQEKICEAEMCLKS